MTEAPLHGKNEPGVLGDERYHLVLDLVPALAIEGVASNVVKNHR